MKRKGETTWEVITYEEHKWLCVVAPQIKPPRLDMDSLTETIRDYSNLRKGVDDLASSYELIACLFGEEADVIVSLSSRWQRAKGRMFSIN